MAATITVLFPSAPDAKYDIEYYKEHHMPLIQSTWEKYGVKGWSVTKFVPGPDGTAPLYDFGSVVHWESASRIKEAFEGPEMAKLMSDVPKFSNKEPVFLLGDVFAQSG